jgi:hypothetical protein
MKTLPRSGYDQVGGMVYFPRLLDKIRLHDRGELPADYHNNLGKGADTWCLHHLRVKYEDVRKRVAEGLSDEQVLQWCYAKGRAQEQFDLMIWNGFITKLGWNDHASGRLKQVKESAGLQIREDITTMFQFFEVDEGRKS